VYDTLKFIHVIAAIAWVGGGLFVQYLATRLKRADDPLRLAAFAKDIEKAGLQFFMPVSLTVLVMGIVLVLYTPALAFTDTWILVGLIGYAATFVTGAFFVGPTSGKLAKDMGREVPDSPAVQAGIRKIFAISRIDQVVLIVVIADMVFKPGR
jgi:uncharacterized membrane protein